MGWRVAEALLVDEPVENDHGEDSDEDGCAESMPAAPTMRTDGRLVGDLAVTLSASDQGHGLGLTLIMGGAAKRPRTKMTERTGCRTPMRGSGSTLAERQWGGQAGLGVNG